MEAVNRRGRAITPAALALMQAILGGRLTAALAEPVTPATYEVATVATGRPSFGDDLVDHAVKRLDRVAEAPVVSCMVV